jgi:phosphopantetheinyl transferase
MDPRKIRFGYAARGKPFLDSGAIGVDVEQVRDIDDASGIAEALLL